jgi:RNA polymerase sigma factor (sigma-70 family)
LAPLWDRDAPEVVLVALARAGDDAAFEELVRRRQQAVRRYLRHLSGNAALGDDLAQETFLSAWRSLPRLREAGAFGGWLRQIAVNVWLQHVRRSRWPDDARDDGDAEDESVLADPADTIDLGVALAKLKYAERTCLVLNYMEGMSHAEIATATGLSLGTVKSHVARAADRLRRLLGATRGQRRGEM